MYIYGDYDNTFIKVSMSSIRYLTEQLGFFISVYEKKILLVTDEDKENFRKLKEIYELLKYQRFDQLIANPTYVIDFQNDSEEYIPKYYPIWMFSMLPGIPIILIFHIYIIIVDIEEWVSFEMIFRSKQRFYLPEKR